MKLLSDEEKMWMKIFHGYERRRQKTKIKRMTDSIDRLKEWDGV